MNRPIDRCQRKTPPTCLARSPWCRARTSKCGSPTPPSPSSRPTSYTPLAFFFFFFVLLLLFLSFACARFLIVRSPPLPLGGGLSTLQFRTFVGAYKGSFQGSHSDHSQNKSIEMILRWTNTHDTHHRTPVFFHGAARCVPQPETTHHHRPPPPPPTPQVWALSSRRAALTCWTRPRATRSSTCATRPPSTSPARARRFSSSPAATVTSRVKLVACRTRTTAHELCSDRDLTCAIWQASVV